MPRSSAAPPTQPFGAGQRVVTVTRDHRTHNASEPCKLRIVRHFTSDNEPINTTQSDLAVAVALPNPVRHVPIPHKMQHYYCAL